MANRYEGDEPGFGQEYTNYLVKRTSFGEWLLLNKYIPNTLGKLRGKVVDLGCGVGEILARCPPGSIGLEVNPTSREVCLRRGLDVRLYDPEHDRYQLAGVEPDVYSSLLMSHVLEHIPDPARVLRTILASCARLGIGRVVLKVPGAVGYRSDKTHVTFVDRAFLAHNGLLATADGAVSEISYYPGNARWLGRVSRYHEMIVVYEVR